MGTGYTIANFQNIISNFSFIISISLYLLVKIEGELQHLTYIIN
ncbi:YvrJ family protein [Intestinibacter sp.]